MDLDVVSGEDQEFIDNDAAHDPAWVYDYGSMQDIGPNSYNASELISMELYDLVNEYNIPREAYYNLVMLINTRIRGRNPKVLNGPEEEHLIKDQSTLTAHRYDVCPSGCMLFHLDDKSTSCYYCYDQRFDNSNKPLSTMKSMSLGDIILRLLANPITRQDFKHQSS
ncbi:hypothetical protein INT46_000598 [Mucor plumbeus]|uniref:Uncharacterized protein n=1 Tax=Mucor plumbeus TaxID=97098 RepID=A0A8H7V2R7_9FUNG|nr:hypothetical protein INT46_000598 [Mucor plumbeus]